MSEITIEQCSEYSYLHRAVSEAWTDELDFLRETHENIRCWTMIKDWIFRFFDHLCRR